MEEDQIRRLLQYADQATSPTARMPADELTRAVRLLDASRRRRDRLLAASAGTVLVLAATAGLAWQAGRGEVLSPTGTAAIEAVAQEDGRLPVDDVDEATVESLEEELRLQELLVRRMIVGRGVTAADAPARRRPEISTPPDELRERLDRIAYRMICAADRLRAESRPTEESIALYRDVIRLFPTTHSAQVARERLRALGAS